MTACAKCGFDPEVATVATFSFLVDRDPPSLNTRLFNSGPRRHLYRKERDLWCWEFRTIRLLQKIPHANARGSRGSAAFGTQGKKRRVTLTRMYGGRQKERDADNLVGGMKAIVDALVCEGLITNDDPSSVELFYQQERGQPVGLLVKIEVLA